MKLPKERGQSSKFGFHCYHMQRERKLYSCSFKHMPEAWLHLRVVFTVATAKLKTQ